MATATAADGTSIHFQVSGPADGEPLLLLQGLGADSRAWMRQRRAFASRYRVVTMDNRGVGRSDRPPGPYTLEGMAEDAVAVLDASGNSSAHLMGASMGGVLAQVLAVRHPERVRSLVLACTACRQVPWRQELLREWREVALEHGMGEVSRIAARWLIGPRMFRRFRAVIDRLGPFALRIQSEHFAAQIDALLGTDDAERFRLRSVDVPTRLVVGSQDILTPVGDSEEIAGLIPDAQLTVLSGAAHGFMVEQAPRYNRAVLDFLDEVAGGQPVRSPRPTPGR